MKSVSLASAAVALLTLAGCDQPKPSPAPEAAAPAAGAASPAATPAPPVAPAPIAPTTEGLPLKDGMAGFYVDYVGAAADPLNKQPAPVDGSQPVTIAGFGFDSITKQPAKGLDLVIEGKAYGATYGAPRADVATFYKTPDLTNVGYSVTFPPGTFAKGEHTLVVRVVSSDGKAHQDSAPVKFQVK